MRNSHSINIGVKKLVVWLLILAGAIEAVWGLLQVYGYEPSNHSLYALTGSFYNPGPYSGFLAMCLPLALYEWLAGKRIGKHLSLVALVLMLVVFPSGMSRSAWLAALVASGYVLGMHYRERFYRYRKFFWVGGLLLMLLGIGAYYWKKDSADGRLLMWKVATQAVLEHPWQGVGWKNVAGAYGDAQEGYFASGAATEQEVHVAGAPEYVFNEYLQVAMVCGVNVFNAQKVNTLSDVALANVEALASSEYDPVLGWACKRYIWDNVMDENFFITIRCSDCNTVSATSASGDDYCRH